MVLLSILGISVFGGGALHGRCVVSDQSSLVAGWNETAFGKASSVGELGRPLECAAGVELVV